MVVHLTVFNGNCHYILLLFLVIKKIKLFVFNKRIEALLFQVKKMRLIMNQHLLLNIKIQRAKNMKLKTIELFMLKQQQRPRLRTLKVKLP